MNYYFLKIRTLLYPKLRRQLHRNSRSCAVFETFTELSKNNSIKSEDEFRIDKNDKVIDKFLEEIENNENITESIDNFWGFLIQQTNWPKFSRDAILRLFYGNGNNLKGLVYHCGTLEDNYLGAEQCLRLLANLLKYEYNPDCEIFRNILRMGKVNNIIALGLKNHLRQNKFNIDGFKILKRGFK